MFTLITSKPGEGKSYHGTEEMVDRVLSENLGYVSTNTPLVLGNVHERVAKYRWDKYRDKTWKLDENLKVMDDSDVYEFYRFRSAGHVLPWSPDHDSKDTPSERMPKPEFNETMKKTFLQMKAREAYCRPVFYFIDEAHDFFDSREWAHCGRAVLFYATKHRHLHDQVYLITQVPGNLEKRLRSLVSETRICRNQIHRSVGPFKMRPVFKVFYFYGCADPDKTKLSGAFRTQTVNLDVKGIGSCYKTVGALGVQSKPEPVKNKGRLPWWTLPVGGALALVVVFFALFFSPKLASGFATKMATAGKKAQTAVQPGANLASSHLPPKNEKINESAKTQSPPPAAVTTVTLEGYAVAPDGRIRVLLSDGRTLDETDPDLVHVGSTYADTKSLGRVYFKRPRTVTAQE